MHDVVPAVSQSRSPSDDRPPASRYSSDLASAQSPEGQRAGLQRSGFKSDDAPPMSSRFDRMPPSTAAAIRPPASIALGAPMRGNAGVGAEGLAGRGGIYRVTQALEKKHGAFFISRLILASGISLRVFDSNSFDDPATMTKLMKTLRNILSPTDMADLLLQHPALNNTK